MCKEAYFTPKLVIRNPENFDKAARLEETDRSLDLYTHLSAAYPQHLYTSHGAMYFYLSFCFEAIPDACITMIGRKTGSMPFFKQRSFTQRNITQNKKYKLKKTNIMPLFRITVKQMKNDNGIRLERGMSVNVSTSSFSNPVTTNGGQLVADAFMRIYGVDIKKAGALNMVYLDVKQM